MKILGIETSCDETGAAIIEDGVKILSNIVASSQEFHIKTGGIIPETAAREQIRDIIPVVKAAVSNLKSRTSDLDALAVTTGPGLIGSLLVGLETAKTLAYIWQKPLIPVNHLLAHLYANWLIPSSKTTPRFPLVALIVSGGHTELILLKNNGQYEWLGGTRDDAAGEAFDKIARLLGLGYPGGPAIAAAAEKYQLSSLKDKVKLPRPMIDADNFDFSFSGLKTAVFREVLRLRTIEQFSRRAIEQLSAETQEAISDVLVEKTIRAAKKYEVETILLAGGVSANFRLREKFKSAIEQLNNKTMLFVPALALCTDNAASVASCAYFNYAPVPWQKIKVNPSLGL